MDLFMDRAREMLADAGYTGWRQARRVKALAQFLLQHPEGARIRVVADEKTGCRYGNRHPGSVKIGYTTYQYQIWAEPEID